MRCLCIPFLAKKCWKTSLFVGSQNREELDNELAYGVKTVWALDVVPSAQGYRILMRAWPRFTEAVVSLNSEGAFSPSPSDLSNVVLVLTCLLAVLIDVDTMLCTVAVRLLVWSWLAPEQFMSQAEWGCTCLCRPGLRDLQSLSLESWKKIEVKVGCTRGPLVSQALSGNV